MRPPICEFCSQRFGPDAGGLVTFRPRPEDLAVIARLQQPGYVGHPPNLGWFCGEHLAQAQGLADLTMGEALRVMAG
jgi:hypothetical protein